MKWNKIGNGDPGYKGSDRHYLVVLHGRFIDISYFFIDSFGHWWSSRWDIWDKHYSDGEVTHWAKLPKMPVVKNGQAPGKDGG